MIISHKHRFIFMHGQKTAGSTITVACSPYFGPHDELTSMWPDVIRNGGRFNKKALAILSRQAPRMFASSIKQSLLHRRLVSSFTVERMNRKIRRYYREKAGFRNEPGHPSALEVKRYNEDAWRDYFKFTVVRNPWDQAVSYYYWQARNAPPGSVTFKEFLKRFHDWKRPDPENVRPPIDTNWGVYTINDCIAVDHVARFENLDDELKIIGGKINLPLSGDSRAKSSFRDKSKSLRQHYDDECIDLVSRIYSKEIAQFGYTLPF